MDYTSISPSRYRFCNVFMLEDWLEDNCIRVEDAVEDTSILYAFGGSSGTLGHLPLSQTVSVTVAGKDYELIQRPDYLKTAQGVTGAVLWSSTPVLLEYLLTTPLLKEQDVILELGSGIGLSACVLSNHCKSFIATDHDLALLRIISKNCESLGVGNAQLVELDWIDSPQTYLKTLQSSLNGGQISTILCLDCVYSSHLAHHLFQCLVAITHSHPDATIVIGQQLREESVHAEFIESLCSHFIVRRVSLEDDPKHEKITGYALYIVKSKHVHN